MIYKICPHDRKGERDNNVWYTEDIIKAARAICDGHEVFLASGVVNWFPADVVVHEKKRE